MCKPDWEFVSWKILLGSFCLWSTFSLNKICHCAPSPSTGPVRKSISISSLGKPIKNRRITTAWLQQEIDLVLIFFNLLFILLFNCVQFLETAWPSPCRGFFGKVFFFFQKWFAIASFLRLRESDWPKVTHVGATRTHSLAWFLNHYPKLFSLALYLSPYLILPLVSDLLISLSHHWNKRRTQIPHILKLQKSIKPFFVATYQLTRSWQHRYDNPNNIVTFFEIMAIISLLSWLYCSHQFADSYVFLANARQYLQFSEFCLG